MLTTCVVAQSMGSAVFIPVAQVVFQNTLLSSLQAQVPEVNPFSVIAAGANKAAIDAFPAEHVSDIVESYARALSFTFVVGVPLAGVGLVVAVFMPWFRYHNESKEKGNEEKEVGDEAGRKGEAEAFENIAEWVQTSDEK